MKNLSIWGKSVKMALIDRGLTMRELGAEVGYSVSVVSSIVGGRYSSNSYKEICEKINDFLGTEGLPERVTTPSDDWGKAVKIELVKRNMTITELAQQFEVSRDKMSLIINGKLMDEAIVSEINSLFEIDTPAVS